MWLSTAGASGVWVGWGVSVTLKVGVMVKVWLMVGVTVGL